MRRLFFIRHGATPGNLKRKYIGRTDEPLSETGIQQAEMLARKMAEEFEQGSEDSAVKGPDHIFTSPMLRAIQTAKIVFPGHEYTIVQDLSETDFGIFEGKSALELKDSREYRDWVDSMCLAPVPGGEDVKAFKERCCNSFTDIMRTVPDNSTVAIIAHGGVIMSIMEAFEISDKSFYDYHIKNCEYIKCQYDETRQEIL